MHSLYCYKVISLALNNAHDLKGNYSNKSKIKLYLHQVQLIKSQSDWEFDIFNSPVWNTSQQSF